MSSHSIALFYIEAHQALERKAQEVHSLEEEIKYYTINTIPVMILFLYDPLVKSPLVDQLYLPTLPIILQKHLTTE